jgi:hypothetical protein
MFTLNEYGEYETEINGIRFVCGTVQAGYEKAAADIAAIYEKRVRAIAQFMQEEGILAVYGEMTCEDMMQALGQATINLDNESISYLNHTLDDDHIIGLEYRGVIETFFCFSMDG